MFLKVGFLGFGGGYAMLTLIYAEGSKLGLTIDQFADLNVLDVLIPGPIAINSATYVGYLFAGLLGSVVATITVSTPSFVLIPTMIRFEDKIKENRYLNETLQSVKAAAVGLIGGVGVIMVLENAFGISSLKEIFDAKINVFLIIITIVGWILHDKYKINPILLTIGAGIIGYITFYIWVYKGLFMATDVSPFF